MLLQKPETNRKIIVDVDAGTDDAWALFMLFKAMDEGLCDIRAITCVHGNTTVNNVVKNVFRILKTVGKESSIPVYKGCVDQLVVVEKPTKDLYHGVDGFGDVCQDQVDTSLVQSKHAVNAIVDLIKENPKDIELIFLGPLTNLALAIRMYGKEVTDGIKEMHLMGGNYMGVGNITKAAEFNFYSDPEAAHIVLDSLTCPINILPLEACSPNVLSIPVKWRFEEMGSIDNNITQLMNPVDHKIFVEREKIYFKPYDAVATAVFLCPEIVGVIGSWHASVELHGSQTRGQLVLDHLKSKTSNVKIVERIDQEMLKKLLLWTVGHSNQVCIQ